MRRTWVWRSTFWAFDRMERSAALQTRTVLASVNGSFIRSRRKNQTVGKRPKLRCYKWQANSTIRLHTFTDRTPSGAHANPTLAPWNREGHNVAMQTPERATKLRFVLPPRFPGATDRAGKQNSPTCDPLKRFNFLKKNGAGEAIRTPDPNLGKVVLYP